MKTLRLILILSLLLPSVCYSQMWHMNGIFYDKNNDREYYIYYGGNTVVDGVEYACLCIYDEKKPNHCLSIGINPDFHEFSNEIRYAFSDDGVHIALLKDRENDGIHIPVRIDIYNIKTATLVKSFDLKEKNIKFIHKFIFDKKDNFSIIHSDGIITHKIK